MNIMSKAKAAWYRQQRDRLQAELKNQKELLPRLTEDRVVVTDPAVKFERERQIDRVKADIKRCVEDLELLEHAFAVGDDSKVSEQYKPKSDKKTPARENQEILLKNVKDAWIEGVLKQSLHNEVLIELRKTQDADAVDRFQQPLHLTQETEDTGQVLLEDDIQEVYEKGGRTLLILGAPGAGKTISLLELTQRLAEDAAFDASQPIPVVFNLSSWAEKKRSLQDWLVDELQNKYRIPTKMGRKWLEDVENQPLVLLLDGLDEVAAKQRAACVRAVNTYRQEYALGGIVVACRVEEYNELADKLKLEQALCVQPLTEEQVGNYLAAGGEELAGLRTALPADAALQELASSPLMLSMMCLAYKGKSSEVILQDVAGNAETRQHNLFSAYVRRMFQRPRSGVHYEEEKTRRWLTFLAHNMQKHGQTIFQMENLQPRWLLTKGGYWLYVMLSSGFICVFIAVTMLSLSFLVGRTSDSTAVGMVVTTVAGLLMGTSFKNAHELTIRREMSQRRLALLNFSISSIVVLPIILLSFYRNIFFVLAYFASIIESIFIDYISYNKKQIKESWRTSNGNAIVVFLFILFSTFMLIKGQFRLIFAGLLLATFTYLSQHSFFKYFTLRFVLWLYGYAPWNYARFLDHATDRLFLRKVGGGYIFVHRLLLEYFAADETQLNLLLKKKNAAKAKA